MHLSIRSALAASAAAAAISALGLVPASAAVHPPRVVQAASPRFACPDRAVCLYEGDKLNGPRPLTLPVGQDGLSPDAPFNLIDNNGQHAGSVRDRPGAAGGDLWVLRRSPHRAVHCIKAGGHRSLFHEYGTGYLLTAGQSHGCTEHAPGFGTQTLAQHLRAAGALVFGSARVKPSEVEICHALDAHEHHHAGLCVAKKGKDTSYSAGNLVVTCDYHCPGKDSYGRVRWQDRYQGTVGQRGYHPLATPLANKSLAGAVGAQFSYAGLGSNTKYCLSSDPTDARGGRASIWNCAQRTFGKFTKWLLWDLNPTASWHDYAIINIYASNAADDHTYYVLSANSDAATEGSDVRVLSFGLVKRAYQIFDGYKALVVRSLLRTSRARLLADRPSGTGGCAPRSSCFYPEVNFGGTPLTVLNASNENTWTSVPPADRKSVVAEGGSDVWLWQRTDQLYSCVKASGGSVSDEDPFNSGYYYVDYGVTGCTEPHPSGAPGSGPDKPVTAALLSDRLDFTCPNTDWCWYSGINWDGTVDEIDFAQEDANSGTWETIPPAEKGSVTDTAAALSLVVYAADTGVHISIAPGHRQMLNNDFGYRCAGTWGGSNNCDHNLPARPAHAGKATLTSFRTACTVSPHNLKVHVQVNPNIRKEWMYLTANGCHVPAEAALRCQYPAGHVSQFRSWFGHSVKAVATGKKHMPQSVITCGKVSGIDASLVYRYGFRYQTGGSKWSYVWRKP